MNILMCQNITISPNHQLITYVSHKVISVNIDTISTLNLRLLDIHLPYSNYVKKFSNEVKMKLKKADKFGHTDFLK